MPAAKPQRLCRDDSCQAVALRAARYCKRHAAERGRARVQRANAVRHERWLPENRSLIGVINPRADSAADIATSAESLMRALEKNHIDRRRAKVLFYILQLSFSELKMTAPKDPNRRAASLALYDLSLTLAAHKGGFTENR